MTGDGKFLVMTAAELFAKDAANKKVHRTHSSKSGFTFLPKQYGKDGYFIEWERADTPERVLSWLHHMHEKSWFDSHYARRFIEAAFKRNGWKLYP